MLLCSSCNLNFISTIYAYINNFLTIICVGFLCNFPNLIPSSPDGRQFESYKEVSSYLDGSQQFSNNINMASENVS
jgi:hypothetical protein